MSKKAIEISAASLLDLRAEISKQKSKTTKSKSSQIEVEKKGDLNRSKNKTTAQWAKKNKGLQERMKRDRLLQEEQRELAPDLEASWIALQRKSELYQQLQSGEMDEDKLNAKSKEELLVDFVKKNSELDDDERTTKTISKKKKILEEIEDPWVESTDEYGRTRIVRKSQLETFGKPGETVSFVKSGEQDESTSFQLMSEDMKQEEERKKWEEEAKKEMEGPLHYDSQKEIRTRGVGYYKLSLNQSERREQLQRLKDLRYQTLKTRASLMEQKKAFKRKLSERRTLIIQRRQVILARRLSKRNELPH